MFAGMVIFRPRSFEPRMYVLMMEVGETQQLVQQKQCQTTTKEELDIFSGLCVGQVCG